MKQIRTSSDCRRSRGSPILYWKTSLRRTADQIDLRAQWLELNRGVVDNRWKAPTNWWWCRCGFRCWCWWWWGWREQRFCGQQWFCESSSDTDEADTEQRDKAYYEWQMFYHILPETVSFMGNDVIDNARRFPSLTLQHHYLSNWYLLNDVLYYWGAKILTHWPTLLPVVVAFHHGSSRIMSAKSPFDTKGFN